VRGGLDPKSGQVVTVEEKKHLATKGGLKLL